MTQIRKVIESIGCIFLMLLIPLLKWVGSSNDRFAVIVVSLFGMMNWAPANSFAISEFQPKSSSKN